MHHWGDEWFKKNGNDLNEAIYFIMRNWKRFGRIGSHGKEKYGTFRDHAYFWNGGLHDLIWPGYVAIQNRFIYLKLDRYLLRPLTKHAGLRILGLKYQHFIYNLVVQLAIAKYSNVMHELVADLGGCDLIKPIFGLGIDGTKIHDLYWTKVI
jgi:hypothetical protein